MAQRRPKSRRRAKRAPSASRGLVFLSAARGRKLLDETARRWLGMSGAQFARLWRAGRIENPDRPEAEVLRVAALLPAVG
jgi:hypothetical protein